MIKVRLDYENNLKAENLYKMQRPIPLATLLRFPIIFGTLLIAGGAAFKYRDKFLGNIEERRSSLLIENVEDRKLLEQKKVEMMKK